MADEPYIVFSRSDGICTEYLPQKRMRAESSTDKGRKWYSV